MTLLDVFGRESVVLLQREQSLGQDSGRELEHVVLVRETRTPHSWQFGTCCRVAVVGRNLKCPLSA